MDSAKLRAQAPSTSLLHPYTSTEELKRYLAHARQFSAGYVHPIPITFPTGKEHANMDQDFSKLRCCHLMATQWKLIKHIQRTRRRTLQSVWYGNAKIPHVENHCVRHTVEWLTAIANNLDAPFSRPKRPSPRRFPTGRPKVILHLLFNHGSNMSSLIHGSHIHQVESRYTSSGINSVPKVLDSDPSLLTSALDQLSMSSTLSPHTSTSSFPDQWELDARGKRSQEHSLEHSLLG